jgi:ribosome assembly protein 1
MTSVFLPPSQTRLLCIAAHVDHGKTTLADNLIATNGLLSERLAGTLRYLDSDPEEQRRGITMRASAIGLLHTHKSLSHVIHLVDSPGHADFGWQVSTSLQASDNVVLVVDVVEGMGPRTHQVFREAHAHQLNPILVINKVDRLLTDLHLDPTEAYLKIQRLLETINAAASAMLYSAQQEDEEVTDEQEAVWTFEPAKGNVVFSSAIHGWGFTVPGLARSLFKSKIIPIKPVMLKQALFSDAKYKNDKIIKWKSTHEESPIFAKYALEPIWNVYKAVETMNGSHIDIETVYEAIREGSTNASLPQTVDEWKAVLVGSNTPESILRTVLRRYRPLAESLLDTVCEYGISPVQATTIRTQGLSLQVPTTEQVTPIQTTLIEAVKTCSTDPDAPTVAHVYKFMATERMHIRDAGLPETDKKHVMLGLTRVLSGALVTNTAYYCTSTKLSSSPPQCTIRLYLIMGSSYVAVDRVPAGHLCAVANLDKLQLKTITLSNHAECLPLSPLEQGIRPLVKVNLEAEEATDTAVLEEGLVQLSLSDSAVEITATARGERLLACIGELHLEQAILDLKTVHCTREIGIRISDPIVDFGESSDWFEREHDYEAFVNDASPLIRQATIPPYSEEEGLATAYNGRSRVTLAGKSAAINLRAVPLAESVYECIKSGAVDEACEEDVLKLGQALGFVGDNDNSKSAADVLQCIQKGLLNVSGNGNAIIAGAGLQSGRCFIGLGANGGDTNGSDARHESNGSANEEMYRRFCGDSAIHDRLLQLSRYTDCEMSANDKIAQKSWDELKSSVVAGFQLAIRLGPICEEPVRNMLIVVEGFEISVQSEFDGADHGRSISSGMMLSAMKSGIRSCLLTRPFRLMEGHLKLTLHSTLAGLGPLYTVLNRRRGKVLDDSMVEGTDLLLITALIPQAESFGLTTELLAKTSGEVTAPELIFSHWERLDVDPFWIPASLEEREDFGELRNAGDVSTGHDNTALKYIRKVRQQKGLVLDSSRTVTNAEKQRTLKR